MIDAFPAVYRKRYEFPFDITRCLELALFHTYGSVSVSRLLDRTGEFRKFGPKRYDDTRVLIAHCLEDGYELGHGQAAIARMNAVHVHFQIPNDDFLFVLSTFISCPVDWLGRNGYRPFTVHEQRAWFVFFRNLGQRIRISDIPETWPLFQQWVDAYEQKIWFTPTATGMSPMPPSRYLPAGLPGRSRHWSSPPCAH